MTIKSCEKFCNRSGLSKWLYLTWMTLIFVGFVIEITLIIIVLVPYNIENKFIATSCTYKSSIMKSVLLEKQYDDIPQPDNSFMQHRHWLNCKNVCAGGGTDGENSMFPCMLLTVDYLDNKNEPRSGKVFDRIQTYTHNTYRTKQCASAPCRFRYRFNQEMVQNLNKSLHAQKKFPCFYNSENLSEVLLAKSYNASILLHSLLWPGGLFVLSVLLTVFMYFAIGCGVWGDPEKSFVA